MHIAVIEFVTAHRPDAAGDVLDVGGRDINGSPRHHFADATTYTVIDLHDAPGVDVVGDICEFGLTEVADTVLCLEVLEHAEAWREIVAACARACRPGGSVLVTCAGPGRPPHSAMDGNELHDGEHYANVAADELAEAMTAAGLTIEVAEQVGQDVRAVGRRGGDR